ncbi:hypothetical protein LINPERPRIM_LOCUS4728, partial [Linum perenne]
SGVFDRTLLVPSCYIADGSKYSSAPVPEGFTSLHDLQTSGG